MTVLRCCDLLLQARSCLLDLHSAAILQGNKEDLARLNWAIDHVITASQYLTAKISLGLDTPETDGEQTARAAA